MISGPLDRRWRRLAWSAIVAIVFNVLLLAELLHSATLLWGSKRGAAEIVHSKQLLTLEVRPETTPQPPAAQPKVQKIQQVAQAQIAAPPPLHELSREKPDASPQPPAPPKPSTLESRISRDERDFASTVAKLNAANDPHAIATMDPATKGGSNKSYSFRVPGGHSSTEGYGIITPSQSWHERGANCYYAHYEYTYPDGAEETGNIVWPVCYDPGADPFKEGRREMPFPLPIAGYRLPAGTDLPPIEKDVYSRWIAQQ
jgi:hypothetical protein